MSGNVMTWDEYKKFVGKLAEDNKYYLYRGQTNDAWKLQTSFHRAATKNEITLHQYLDTIIPEVHYYICATHDQIIDLNNNLEHGAFFCANSAPRFSYSPS